VFPDLFSIGPITLHTYGLFIALGLVSAVYLALRSSEEYGLQRQMVMDMAFWAALFGVLGARAAFVLMNMDLYSTNPISMFKIWQGGLVFSGGMIASIAFMIVYIRKKRLEFWKVADLFAPSIALGASIGRLGCFSAGCCYGKPCNLPFAVVFHNPHSLAPLNVPLHPTQLYHAALLFIIFLILMRLRKRRLFDGQVFLWFLILHSFQRLFVERFRGDFRNHIPGTEMTVTQLISLLILTAAIFLLLKKRPKKEDKRSSHLS